MSLLDKLKGLFKPKDSPENYLYLQVYTDNKMDLDRIDVDRVPKNHICLTCYIPWFDKYTCVEVEASDIIKVKIGNPKYFEVIGPKYVMNTTNKTIYLFKFESLIKTDMKFISYIDEVRKTDPYPIITS